MDLRNLAKKNPPLREGSGQTDLDSRRVAGMPGDGEPEDHVVEQLAPSAGRNAREMEKARRGHRIAEEDPERGAWHLGIPPTPDQGGETQEYTGDLGGTERPKN